MSQTKNSQYKEEKKAIESAFDKLKNKTGETPVLAVTYIGADLNILYKGSGERLIQLLTDSILGNEVVLTLCLGAVTMAMTRDESIHHIMAEMCNNIKEYETTRPETVS